MKRQGSNDRILYLLKTRGPQTATVIAQNLDMTMMGARQQLFSLQEQSLVESYQKAQGRGRPKLFWQLSDAGQNRFPDRHSDLTLNLIETIKTSLGKEALDMVIEQRGQQITADYLSATNQVDSLKDKLEILVELRNAEGYMASLQDVDDEHYLFIENHCPICAAATACQGFCSNELNMLEQCLVTKVVRSEYILEGARRCAYKVFKI